MLNIFRVGLGNRALQSFKIHQRNNIQLWFAAKQVINHQKPAVIKQCVQHLGVKNTTCSFPTISGAPVALFCSKRTQSKSTQNTTAGENFKSSQRHNIVCKFGTSAKDHKPPLSSESETGVPSNDWGPYVVSQIHRLEESFRFHGYSILRWGLSGFAVLFGFVYLFRDTLRDNVADEVADVAARSMADENVVSKAHGMTKGVLNRLVSEPETISLVSDFIMEVLQKEDVRRIAVQFTASILNHPDTLEKIQTLTRNTVQSVLNDNETKSTLLNFIKSLIEDQQTKDACFKLLMSLTEDPKIREMITEFLKSVLASPKFQMEAVLLGREVTNKIVQDKTIQQDTGDALWSAVKYGVTPHWFREE